MDSLRTPDPQKRGLPCGRARSERTRAREVATSDARRRTPFDLSLKDPNSNFFVPLGLAAKSLRLSPQKTDCRSFFTLRIFDGFTQSYPTEKS